MTSAVQAHPAADHTELRSVVRGALILGVIQTLLVFGFALASRALEGTPELLVRSLIVLFGVAITTLLPGILTRPRTVEGIAGAAGIGLAATVVFLVLDIAILQPLGTYTNRWLEIGGGSNWWYHPVWWMVGTFLPWMGAFALSNQANRSGASPVVVLLLALVFSGVFGAVGVLVGVPLAGWNLATFAVAFLPAIALTAVITGLGTKRA
jgi:hypothetical protein